MTSLMLLYRGRLKSCNYDCSYCPFAKGVDTRESLEGDAHDLERFVDWIVCHPELSIGVLFTPWGEALIRRHYRQAIVRLSMLDHVRKVAAQTNLSHSPGWLREARRDRVALWCTYHPSQVSRADFLGRCQVLDQLGVRHSVGMVGLHADMPEVGALRDALPASTYLWVNAYKREPGYYTEQQVQALEAIDPLFHFNLGEHPSRGKACLAGEQVVSVLGDGTVRRCHFIEEPIGNLYERGFLQRLVPRPCTARSCRCHIGYVHMPGLGLRERFGDGVLERIPARLPVVG